MSAGDVLAHVEDAPKREYSESDQLSKNRKIIGYAIGVLGLIVSGLIVCGLGHEWFHYGKKRLTPEERNRPAYEDCLALLPEMHFLAFAWWIYAVYKNKRIFMLISIVYWSLDLLLAALAVFFYFYGNIQPKEGQENRELYVTIGIVYWICSYIVAMIWYVTKPNPPGVSLMEELKALNNTNR